MLPGALRLKLAVVVALTAALARLSAADAALPEKAMPIEGRYLRREVPDVRLREAQGDEVPLARLWAEKPILLVLVFSRCAGVCSPFLGSLRRAQATVGGSGTEYRTVVLSFDPRDTEADMLGLARRLGLAGRRDWIFGTARSEDVRRLAGAVGFWFAWDAPTLQFDHPSLLVAVERGRVARLLVGEPVEPVRLEEVIRELRGEFVSAYPLPRNVLFRCFQYDPRSGRFVLDWGFLVLALPGALAVAGTLGAFAAARRGRPS